MGFIAGLSEGDGAFLPAEAKGILLGFWGAILYGLLGLPIGAIAGSKDIFVMPASKTTPAPVLVPQLPGSKILPEELSSLTGNQIRVLVSEGVKYQGFT